MAPQIWEYTLDLPEELQGDGGEPSHGENAIFIALTLFAMHAQGSDDIVHWKDVTLGTAVSKLRAKFQDSEKGIRRRFDALITAKSCDEIAVHARGMIQLLKAGGIGLDYGQFAAHVYLLQFPESAKRVRLSWGQDYFRSSVVHDQEGAENE